MTSLLFVTSNSRKITEASATLAAFGVTLTPIALAIDEIQHSDPAEIAKAKARAAYAAAGQPVVVSDTSWAIPALGGFPGGYMKDIAAWLSTSDWVALMQDKTDRTLLCQEHVAYCDGETVAHFVEVYRGHFVTEPRGQVEASESFEALAVLYGGETMAEQLTRGDIASAGEELGHWRQFGEWYAARVAPTPAA